MKWEKSNRKKNIYKKNENGNKTTEWERETEKEIEEHIEY